MSKRDTPPTPVERLRKIERAEKRIVRAAMRLANAGRGFVYKDSGMISDAKAAMALESACGDLKEARKL